MAEPCAISNGLHFPRDSGTKERAAIKDYFASVITAPQGGYFPSKARKMELWAGLGHLSPETHTHTAPPGPPKCWEWLPDPIPHLEDSGQGPQKDQGTRELLHTQGLANSTR